MIYIFTRRTDGLAPYIIIKNKNKLTKYRPKNKASIQWLLQVTT